MKKAFTVSFLAILAISLFLLSGCGEVSSLSESANDADVCSKGCIVYFHFFNKQYLKQGEKCGKYDKQGKYSEKCEAFYTGADDMMWYNGTALAFLEKHNYFKNEGIKYFNYDELSKTELNRILGNNKDFLRSLKRLKGYPAFVFYISGEKAKDPKLVYPIDIIDDFIDYFDYNKDSIKCYRDSCLH